jgi:hypothetical protein
MSFWSSLILARAAPPPVVAAAEMGLLVRKLIAIDALAGDEAPLCQIKYGPRVDADEQTTNVVDWDESGVIGTVGEYPWDRSDTYPSLAELVDDLAHDDGTLYRAYVSLGSSHPEIVSALTREPSEQNEVALCLDSMSFSIGPVLVGGLDSQAPAFAGWLGLSFSGPGYYFPWTYREARERAEKVAKVRQVADACRSVWPVKPTPASAAAIAGRRELAELWLYDDATAPLDWLWFVSEG